MRIQWEEGFEIRSVIHDGEVTISANRAGLLSLAGILTKLANESSGAHVHLDEDNSLEDGSVPLVIEIA